MTPREWHRPRTPLRVRPGADRFVVQSGPDPAAAVIRRREWFLHAEDGHRWTTSLLPLLEQRFQSREERISVRVGGDSALSEVGFAATATAKFHQQRLRKRPYIYLMIVNRRRARRRYVRRLSIRLP